MFQSNLFDNSVRYDGKFLSTRFQGSKLKIVPWIWSCIQHLKFDTCLDAFGGTGSVAYYLKKMQKEVDYNDNLQFNYTIGKAIIENDETKLENDEIDFIISPHDDVTYQTFIKDTFRDIFFLDEENGWLDMVVTNIRLLDDEYKRAIAFTALFQACIIKRPYNLFHRANLYMRTAEVKRSFGNKTTWDKPFPEYFRVFAQEVNSIIFSNGRSNRALYKDVFNVEPGYDLVYMDTPYINAKGTGVDYLDFYHFLDGMLDYDNWGKRITQIYKHKRLKGDKSLWCQPNKIHDAFDRLFRHFKDSLLVISYRSHGIPSQDELVEILSKYKSVTLHKVDYKYVLSKNNGQEILLVGV